MKVIIILCLCACVFVSGQDINAMRNMPKYDRRYDYLDVDAILDSKRLVRNYVDCLINVKPCTPEGKALKRILPEALRTKCVRCSERQKRTAVKVIRRLKYEYPTEWSKLSSRWDPTGDFTRFFEDYLAKEQFNNIDGNGNEVLPVTMTTARPPPPTPAPTQPAPPPSSVPTTLGTTSPRPVILNRFGDEGELMIGSPSSIPDTKRPGTQRPMETFATSRPVTHPRPTQTMMWAGSASEAIPTRFPLRPVPDMPPPYSTAITFIDQIGIKIIRTTELVTDILRNTVRAVVGR